MPASGSSKIISSGIFGQQGRNLDALDLAAGQARVHVAVQIVARAQTHLRQIPEQASSWESALPAAMVE